MKVSRPPLCFLLWGCLSLSACNGANDINSKAAHTVTVTTPEIRTVAISQQYSCQIDSYRHITVYAPTKGYLGAIPINEGQKVKQDDLLFQIKPAIGKEEDTGNDAHAILIKAPFEGVVGSLPIPQGAAVQKGEPLTTLDDNSQMYVYFNVPDVRYREYITADPDQDQGHLQIELILANGARFDQPGKLGTIGTDAGSGTGMVRLRATFPNPDRLLRHGQAGITVVSQAQEHAMVIPARAVFDVLGTRYVYVVDKGNVAHRREIVIENELEDLFVVKRGIDVDDKIVVDGIRQIEDGDAVEYDDRQPQKTVTKR